MNAINLLFSQPPSLNSTSSNSKGGMSSEGFLPFLNQIQTESGTGETQLLTDQKNPTESKDLLMLLLGLSTGAKVTESSEEIIDTKELENPELLNQLLEENIDLLNPELTALLTNLLQPEPKLSQLLEQIQLQISKQTDEVNLEALENTLVSADTVKVIESELVQLYTQVEVLISSISSEEDLVKVSPKLLELLEKWTSLEKSLNREGSSGALIEEDESSEMKIWKDLLQSFEKRSQLASGRQYNSEAEVTSKDVSKWLNNGINTLTTVNNAEGLQQTATQMPMSKLEQYAIHINLADNTEPADKQLIKEFQNVMKTGRFVMDKGMSQFTIALRPGNLGEMMVRLTQIDGEMTLKILVSSQATKQMLEGNIKELRSMFAPHQVVIEKQEIDVQNIQKDNEDQPLDDHDESETNHSDQNQQSESDGEFEKQFQELLMNLKV